MSTITTSTAYKTLKATLEKIVTDPTDGIDMSVPYMTEGMMTDAYEDDLENGGPGLVTEVAEGAALSVLNIYDGASTRYNPRKFGGILEITEELDDDGKYNDKYIKAAKRLKRAVAKTLQTDCANVLNRATTAGYVGGDGVVLASASHTLPGGGTYSNILSTAFSPALSALIVVRNNLAVLPGHDGVTEGYTIESIVHPPQQWGAWAGILGSDKRPENGNNEKNVMHGLGIKQIEVKFMTSATNWGVLTSAPDGLKLRWRKKPKARTWVDENTETIRHGVSARWARGWTNPRGVYWSNA